MANSIKTKRKRERVCVCEWKWRREWRRKRGGGLSIVMDVALGKEKKGYIQYNTIHMGIYTEHRTTDNSVFTDEICGIAARTSSSTLPAPLSSIYPRTFCFYRRFSCWPLSFHSIPLWKTTRSRTRDKRHPCFLNVLAVFRFAEGKRTRQTYTHNVTHPLFRHPKVKLEACWSCFWSSPIGPSITRSDSRLSEETHERLLHTLDMLPGGKTPLLDLIPSDQISWTLFALLSFR